MAFLSFPSPTQLKNLANPTDNQDAVTLAYLDTALNGSGNIVVANVSANTVTSNNVTANTVTVNGIIDLGNVANVKIDGGTDGYVLSTDGTGNLSWVEQTGGSGGTALPSVNVDSFVADGSTNSYQLTVTPASKALVFINIDGVFQIRDSFDLFGNAISFGSTPLTDSIIEVSTFVVGTAGSSGGNIDLTSVSGNIIPSANITYDLGSPTNRWRDLYLSGNTIDLGGTLLSADAANNTVTLGNVSISHDGNGGVSVGNITLDSSLSNVNLSQDSFLPFNLTITPEVLSIQVQANEAGDNIRWLWTWQQSTLPYARATITNQFQPSVPLYFQGTYQLDNFADTIYGDMTQAHKGYFKWVEGAGLDNQISWATTYTEVSSSHPDINNGTPVTVQRYNFQVPSSITIPTLTTPANIGYQVSFANAGAYTFGASMMNGSMMDNVAEGENPSIGPMYRGGTYTFYLDSTLTNHPFYLTTDSGQNFVANAYVGEYTSGVTGSRNNGTAGKETLTFTVPMNAPDTLYYQCGVHAAMHGAITIKDLEVTTNINGNYIVYFQHLHEGHVTPIELRPIPALVNQMCLVYDAVSGTFVPQDLATYVENTPSFKNKIREVAGTATLVAPDGVAVVPTVLTVEDSSYLPIIGNNDGDIAFDAYTDTVYVWYGNQWKNTKGASTTTQSYVKEYYWRGQVSENVGTLRHYIHTDATLTGVYAYLVTPGLTQSTAVVKKNGTIINTITIPANTTTINQSGLSVSLVAGDFLTVDITQGSSANDLYINFVYTG